MRRKEIVIIETEWDKRRERRERTTKAERDASRKRQKAQGSKHKFISRTAKNLRQNTPKSELWFSELLKQHGMENLFLSNIQLNDLIPDFLNVDHRIIVEVDGSIHWNNAKQAAKDQRKDQVYKSMGYTSFRVNHKDIAKAIQIIDLIKELIQGDSNKP
jgi:very-short-patch-repair endonuclease